MWLPTREGDNAELKLTISLDVDGGGWLVEMTTPGRAPGDPPTYSRIVIPMAAIEQDRMDDYADALLAMHLRFMGL